MTFDIKTYIQNLCAQFAPTPIESGSGSASGSASASGSGSGSGSGAPDPQAFDFQFTEVSGLDGLEGILSGQVYFDNFVAVDATGDGAIQQQRNGGYFITRVGTVFIVRKYQYGDMADMLNQMRICRFWFKRILRRMVAEQEQLKKHLIYLNTERLAFREFAPETAGHFTGLYFMIAFQQPYDVLND